MPRRHLHLLALFAALVMALLTSCGGQTADQKAPPLPGGASLLGDSANAMRTVMSTRVAITVDGDLPDLPIKAAEGQITKDGSAKGTASVDFGAQPYEVSFVIIGQDLYLRGPTGGYKQLSTSSAFLVYDPTVILNPDRGVAAVLAHGTGAKTEGRESVNGVDSYRVRASFSGQSLAKLVPGFTQGKTAEVWIATNGFRLQQAQFPTKNGSITFHFSDYDAPADISPPS
ncbi:MAG TPA: LppX_LprAFG lipoprotein [Pseudonocardiaceae bacterium]